MSNPTSATTATPWYKRKYVTKETVKTVVISLMLAVFLAAGSIAYGFYLGAQYAESNHNAVKSEATSLAKQLLSAAQSKQ